MQSDKSLIAALLLMFAGCCYSITLSSPSPNSVLVAGSTTPISWSDNTSNKTVVFDILLGTYKPKTSKSQGATVSVLATDIDASAAQPIFVIIPNSLNLTKAYTISLKKTSTSYSISSVGPLRLVPSKIDESNNTPPSVTQHPTLMVSRQTPDETSTPLPVSLSLDEADKESNGNAIGPTLSSAKVACIAMSVVLFASALFGIYVLIRNIIQRRRQRDTEEDVVDLSNHRNLVPGYYASPTTTDRKKKRTDNIEITRDYHGLYYTEGFTDVEPYSTISDKGNRKRPISPLHVSSDDHNPFGKPPQNFNQNAYYIYNELPLPPQQAYGSYHTSTTTAAAENRAASRSSNRRMSSPTIPHMSPTLSHTK